MTTDNRSGEQVAVTEATGEDLAWGSRLVESRWGPVVISRGRVHQVDRLRMLVATLGGERAGALTFRIDGGALEILTVDAENPHRGVGTALLRAAEEVGRAAAARRMWLITSNDNLQALNFYVRRGFRLVAVHLDAVERARALKPSIPVIGEYGIPVRRRAGARALPRRRRLPLRPARVLGVRSGS